MKGGFKTIEGREGLEAVGAPGGTRGSPARRSAAHYSTHYITALCRAQPPRSSGSAARAASPHPSPKPHRGTKRSGLESRQPSSPPLPKIIHILSLWEISLQRKRPLARLAL